MALALVDRRPEPIRFPLMEQPVAAMVLAFVAGTMDAWTYRNATTFATVQSGNVISSGYWLVQGDWERFTFAIVSVLSFGVGSLVGGAFMTGLLRRGKSFAGGILIMEAAILVVLAIVVLTAHIDARYIAHGVSFVAGVQGNAFHKVRGLPYGNVAVTGVVQMAFNFLVQSLFSKKGINDEPNLTWAGIYFSILIAFAGGGGVGALAAKAWDGSALFIPAGLLVVLGVFAFNRSRRDINPDPTPGGVLR